MTLQSLFFFLLCAALACLSWALGKRSGALHAHLELSQDLARSQAQVTELRERLAQEHTFQSLLADSQSQAAQLESAQHQRLMQTILPINEGLKLLQTSVSSLERQQAAQIGALDQQLKWTRESEDLLRQSTQELTRTLSHAPLRGTWGEAQLRSLVESAGLIEHVHFDTQVPTAGRSKRPDMIVFLPQDKCIPVDAKVPLDAYLRAQSEDTPLHLDGEDPSDQTLTYEQLMLQHAKSLRRHVSELSRKEYWKELPHTADYVIAFVPSESILSAALHTDPSLMHDALNMNVVLASPTSLWAILRTVAFTWRQQSLSTQAQEIIQLSQELYERLQTLGKHASKVSVALNNASQSWNSFLGSFESRALVSARKLSGIHLSSEPLERVHVEAKTLTTPLSQATENPDFPAEGIS